MKKRLLILLLATAAAFGQANTRAGKVTADSVVISGTGPTASAGLNASAALHTLPFKVGLIAGLPATCTVGERYFASNAITAGQNSYSCTALNTWTLDFGAGIAVSSGTVDFGSAGHTRPAKVGLIAALPATCTVGEVYFATDATAGRNWYFCTALNTWTAQLSSAGTVTSVAMTVPAFMGIAGSPVTTAGTLALTMNNQNQNLFLAGPGSGAAATPSFRAIVALDLGTGTADATTMLGGDLTWRTFYRMLDKQDQIAGLAGNSADQTLYTYSMPSGTMAAGKCVRINLYAQETVGSSAPTFKIFFGATAVVSQAMGASGDTPAVSATVCNNAASTTAQWGAGFAQSGNVGSGTLTRLYTSPAENTASGSPIVVKGTFNVANTTTITGKGWTVESTP